MQGKIIEPKLYIYLLQHVSLASHLPFIQGYFKFSNFSPFHAQTERKTCLQMFITELKNKFSTNLFTNQQYYFLYIIYYNFI